MLSTQTYYSVIGNISRNKQSLTTLASNFKTHINNDFTTNAPQELKDVFDISINPTSNELVIKSDPLKFYPSAVERIVVFNGGLAWKFCHSINTPSKEITVLEFYIHTNGSLYWDPELKSFIADYNDEQTYNFLIRQLLKSAIDNKLITA